MAVLLPGQIRLSGVSRRFRVIHDRSMTLKETLIRRERARYSELWALRNVDLDIQPGEAVGIVGRNGSGKSTLLKMLAGIIPPHTGVVQTGGAIASMLELGAGFHPDFTGRENVFMNGAIHGLSEKEVARRLDAIIEFSELPEFIDMPVRTYSSGMQMRLAFAVTAHLNPDILLLDEVLAVGDEAFQRKCMGRIHDFRRTGGTLVFVSHDPNAVEQICDRAVLIDGGRIVQDDLPAAVMETYHRLLAEGSSAIGARVEAIAEPGEPTASDEWDETPPPSPLGGWGTGEVAITNVLMIGPEGATDRFVSGDSFILDITLEAHQAIAGPSVGVSIASGDGTVCFGTNTHLDSIALPVIDGGLRVRFALDHLPLHEGSFDVTVAVHSHDETTIFHWIDRVTTFSVFQHRPGVGLVAMEPTWGIETMPLASTARGGQ